SRSPERGDGSCPAMRRFAPRSNAMAKRKSQSVPLVCKRYRAQTEPSSPPSPQVDRRILHPPTLAPPGKAVLQPFEHQLAAIAVLHIGAGDRYGQDQTQYIDHDMPLTTLGALRSIVAPIAPFCCVATLWLSTIAALGQICRPLLTRT